MRSADIKNLSISLEALSRIQGCESEEFSVRIRGLLHNVITEEEHNQAKVKLPRSEEPDDEIPF